MAVDSQSFLLREVRFGGDSHRYQVYVPDRLERLRPPPIVLYLHGKGRGGRDGTRQIEGGLAAAVRESPDGTPCVIAFPQSPDDAEFVGRTGDLAMCVLATATDAFGADETRTYVAGGSMGGHGAYHLAQRHPGRFAAMAVTCGSPVLPRWRTDQLGQTPSDTAEDVFRAIARRLDGIPLWAFHGDEDEVVPIAEARLTVRALKELGSEARLTEFPGRGHDACDLAFRDPDFWPWLLGHRLGGGSHGG